ncbi:MAG TPA: ABC transporter permease [Blastocatellia bacterium]|nr:ABC transporter permease [Blastocatellia bacterium]
METLAKDLRYAVRMLIKGRTVTAIALLALTLGIGANTAIFSVINAVLIKPLPYPRPEQLVRVYERSPQFEQMSVAYPNFLDWQRESKAFEHMAVFRHQQFNITGGAEPEHVNGRLVSADFFATLGVRPAMGRDLEAADDRPGASPVVVLSHGFWQRRFGGDSNILNKPLTVNGKDYIIVGVMPASFKFYSPVDLFVPISLQNDVAFQVRDFHPGLQVIARLRQGAMLAEARDEMQSIAAALEQQYPASNTHQGVAVVSMHEDIVHDIRPLLLLLLGAVGLVLLIACANVANLLLARAAARQKEMAIRTALGASRWRIVRQLLTESVLLSAIGGGLGLLLAMWGTDALIAAIPDTIPRAEDIGLDARVMLFTLLISALTGCVFGLIPALHVSKPDLNETLKEGGRTAPAMRQGVRGALVVVEVVFALVLLVGAGLLIRSLFMVRNVAPGVNPKNVITMQIPLSSNVYDEPTKIRSYFDRLLDQLHATPGVQAAALTANMPFIGEDSEAPFWVGNGPRPAPEAIQWALMSPVSAGYAQAMGIPQRRGRFISKQDTKDTPAVAVIDEYMARDLFPGEDPIGKRLTIPGNNKMPDFPFEIIGVVGHVKHFGLDAPKEIPFQFYMAYVQVPDQFITGFLGMGLVARTTGDPAAAAAPIKEAILAVDKDQPVTAVRTLEQVLADSLAQRRFTMLLLGLFAAVALVLAAVGIYGVMSYTVAQRTHEIGVRMALGARPGDVLAMVVRQGMMIAGIGVGIGLVAAFALTRLMASFLFGVSATDPLTFIAIALVLTGVALGACFVPARRATRVDPMVALRYE